jgi:hypothetical protein
VVRAARGQRIGEREDRRQVAPVRLVEAVDDVFRERGVRQGFGRRHGQSPRQVDPQRHRLQRRLA